MYKRQTHNKCTGSSCNGILEALLDTCRAIKQNIVKLLTKLIDKLNHLLRCKDVYKRQNIMSSANGTMDIVLAIQKSLIHGL